MNINKAGCILIDKNNRKVCLVYRDKNNDYSFPKGHIENDESLLECAIRETEEETKRIPVIDSRFKDLKTNYDNLEGNVTVYYFVAYDGGKSDNNSLDTHSTIWVDYDEVLNKLTYDSDKELWNKLLKKGI